jgi:capsular exopolysaccharide synthesis family protein
LNFFDQRFRDVEEIEDLIGFDVIGTIPYIRTKQEMEMINCKRHPKDPIIEAYRSLRTNIRFLDKERNIKKILITSNNSGEGKSLTAINLASVMADSGDKVVLIDADLRKPSLHKFFKTDRIPGLVELLDGRAKLNEVMKKVKDNLFLIAAGELVYNPQGVLESPQFDKFLEIMKRWADYVIIDSIPILSMSDAGILSTKVDGSVLVIDSKKSTKRDTLLSKQKVLRLNSKLLGIVLNNNKKNYRKYNVYYYKKYT